MVNLSDEDKNRLYVLWQYSIIIKTFGAKFNHQYLKTKLEALWCLSEPLCLIDLGLDFNIVKFQNPESQAKILQGGPWFIVGSFLMIRKWGPNFVPSNSKIHATVVWVRLSQLPTEFHYLNILEWVSRKLLKVDACTFTTIRGRYAPICIHIDLGCPVKTFVTIENHK